ncbi:MAG: low molecular weight phosphotyrosine protein phosphatase [Gemmatimonadota bacterium]|nr:low molecular weight phosphotyrosine protein phosphatase [Gemmatimonadota bacterium]
MTSSDTVSVLFVCLGNICRSPLAEGVFQALAMESDLADRFRVDSAGTGAYHVGEAPDPRSVAVAREHGVQLTGLARQVTPRDLTIFDWVVAMDESNRRSLRGLEGPAGGNRRVVLLRDFDPESPGADVPDPYYGGVDGFERVFQIVDRSCRNFLDEISGQVQARSFGG